MKKIWFFFSLPMFTNIYGKCTLNIRTAWKQSEKNKIWKLMCETIGPLPTSDYYYYFILFKYHHWQNPMQNIVPKPTPNCFALLCIFSSRFSHLLLQTEHLEATKAQLELLHQSCLFVWRFFQIWKFFN